jgi:polyisoprenyl-teichoic acid--peptidoglycan teichoic acid transferase
MNPFSRSGLKHASVRAANLVRKYSGRYRFVLLLGLLSATCVWVAATPSARPYTLLVLGSDCRHAGEPSRSDSIFVLRADPESGTVRGLALPRDLYVPLSGLPVYRTSRINAALFYGDYYMGNGGIDAARSTIEELTGVPIDGTVVVYFDFVKDLVDTLGGVEVYFDRPVYDRGFEALAGPQRSLLRFESGWNYLNGERAVKFIRLRRPDTDFGRISRNQRLLSAIRARARTFAGRLRLLRLLPRLGRGIDTDMGPLELAHAIQTFCVNYPNAIEWTSISMDEVVPTELSTGAKVLVPESDVLEEAGHRLMGEPRDFASASALPQHP